MFKTESTTRLTLSPEQLQKFRAEGYIAIPHLLEAEEVAQTKLALKEMTMRFHQAAAGGTAQYKQPIKGSKGNYDGGWVSFSDRTAHLAFEPGIDPLSMTAEEAEEFVRNIYDFAPEAPLFTSLVADHRIKGVCEQLLGEDTINFSLMALSKPAKIGGEKPWHQDNAYFKWLPLEQVIGCWIALDDAGPANGCMHVLPGEHHRSALKHIHTFDCQIAPDRMSSAKPVPVPLPPGGGMFFSCLLPHQTPPNRTDMRRRALQFHYRGVSTHAAEREEYDKVFVEADGTPASCAASKAT